MAPLALIIKTHTYFTMEEASPRSSFLLSSLLFLCFSFLFSPVHAKIQFYNFEVQETGVTKLCKTRNAITVNGMIPGPSIEIYNGDTLVVSVVNRASTNITIHWHGVRQIRTGWADGPEFVTQCPIRPEGRYTYRFTIKEQEGTLWWHAHSSWLRSTVYGSLIIRPSLGTPPPYTPPDNEHTIILGEWWKQDPLLVVRKATMTGGAPALSDAFTINGNPGHLYPCSRKEMTVINVSYGETNLLRVINAALNQDLFFTVADHLLTVVAADASYVKQFSTSTIMIGPGQTTDLLIKPNHDNPSSFYIAAHAYASAPPNVPFNNGTTTAVLNYNNYKPSKITPAKLPAFNDTSAATSFSRSFKNIKNVHVSEKVDEDLFLTVGLGLRPCPPGAPARTCQGPNGTRFAASMNNVSFVLPSNWSILQAYQLGIENVFTTDFPRTPPVEYNYTGNVGRELWNPESGTRLYKLRYGDEVRVVLQGTNVSSAESHPVHLHGYDFYVLGEGVGNFDYGRDGWRLNRVDPHARNTVNLPVNGWVVIQFVADNPGVWLLHCHLDVHITWGLAMAFLVEDGDGVLESVEPPPFDLPLC